MGEVAEALRKAKAELAAQITEQTKAKSDTDLSLDRAKEDKAAKEKDLDDAQGWVAYYQNMAKELQADIDKLTTKITSLTEVSNNQQKSIDELTAAHAAKHNAAQVANDLEMLITSLNAQIANKTQIKSDTKDAHKIAREKAEKQCSTKIQNYDDIIANLTLAIETAEKELGLLKQKHTVLSCAEKEAKKETICKRCTASEQPCGDKCISSDETCHHDKGCACSADAGGEAALIEDEDDVDAEGHPLQTKLNDAKASIRKVIAQVKSNINNLKADIDDNERKREETLKKKRQAIEDFDYALKQLSEQHKELSSAHDTATSNKAKSEDELATTISQGQAAINALETQLTNSINALNLERKNEQKARASEVISCEEFRKAQLQSQGNTISALDSEIAQLQQELQDAQSKLAAVKDAHLSDDDTSTTAAASTKAATTTAAPASTTTEAALPPEKECPKLNSDVQKSCGIDKWHDLINLDAKTVKMMCAPKLVLSKGSTCEQWCSKHGYHCLRAQDNTKNTCNLDGKHTRQSTANNGCDQKWNNQVCQCGKKA